MLSEDAFWDHVNKGPGCWLWTGGRNKAGYGYWYYDNDTEGSHRVVWRLTFGNIPKGLMVLHHCDNPPCVRPDHLFLGTHVDNAYDAIAKDRITSNLLVRKPNERRRGLLDQEAQTIQSRYCVGGSVSHRVLASWFGLTPRQVLHIADGKSWRLFTRTE